jgi:hypothetical protein
LLINRDCQAALAEALLCRFECGIDHAALLGQLRVAPIGGRRKMIP